MQESLHSNIQEGRHGSHLEILQMTLLQPYGHELYIGTYCIGEKQRLR